MRKFTYIALLPWQRGGVAKTICFVEDAKINSFQSGKLATVRQSGVALSLFLNTSASLLPSNVLSPLRVEGPLY